MASALRCILALLLVLCSGLVAGQGSGEGLGLSPPRIDIPDAQAGETYLRTIQVQNPTDTPSRIGVERSGDVATWVSTEPNGNFTIPAHAVRDVQLSIAVPESAGLGTHTGQMTFIADAKTSPGGSGSTFRPAVGLLLNVTVGGEPVQRLTWLSARVEDAQSGGPIHAFVLTRNDGNVRTTAEASGQIVPFDSEGTALLEATGSRLLQPGEQAEVAVTFSPGLAPGQYRARLLSPPSDGFEETHAFKVLPPGGQAPDGLLRAILHANVGVAGRPIRIDAWFENSGNLTIASAAFHGEVRRGNDLLATLDSEALVVNPGQQVNLTAYWTPTRAGSYLVSGHVTYDGYQTFESQSILNVKGNSAGAFAWWWLVLVAAIVGVVVAVWAWRRRRSK